jgi:DNA-binding transcriptional ArsR family regulator
VPRAAATPDVFHAIADSRRREILVFLAPGERSVNELVGVLRLRQPSISKHLQVLRSAGLVHVRREGRQKLYRTNARAIRPVHDWTRTFESFWRSQLLNVKERAEGRRDS